MKHAVWMIALLLTGCGAPADEALAPVLAHEPPAPQEPQRDAPPRDPKPEAGPDPEPAPEPEAKPNSTVVEPVNQTQERPPYWFPMKPSKRDWGDPDTAVLRPGVDLVGGGQCTSNFVFHLNDARYFLGAAAHCFQNSDDPTYAACPADGTMAPGAAVDVYGIDNSRHDGVLAYSSFWSMEQVDEQDQAACAANDFALVEVAAEKLHPKVLGFGGPTGLASPEQYLDPGDELLAYANSDTRPTWLVHGEGFVARGEFTDYSASGWGVEGGPHVVPLVPGDSGGPVVDGDGQAVGALSVLKTAEAQTRWTNLARALWYMYEIEGWAPSLVTWQEFEG